MTFRVGLIGLGQIGALYDRNDNTCMTHLRAINQNGAFDLSFAVDPCYSAQEGKAIASDAFFSDINNIPEDLLCVDLLVICTPTPTHASIIKETVVLSDCKKVLCEKPLADTVSHVAEIDAFCRANSVDIKVNFMRRSLPSFQSVLCILGEANTTEPCDVLIVYSGDFANNASHFIDLVLFWFSTKVKICTARFDKIGMIACDLEVGRALVSIRPNPVQTVTDHRITISSKLGRFVFEKAGRLCDYYEPNEDPDFSGLQSYEKVETIETDYTRFMSYVYRDVEDWMKTGQSGTLCSKTHAEHVSEVIEGIKNVALTSN